MADRITANGPLAVAKTKEVLVRSGEWAADEAFARQLEVIGPVFGSEDAREGATAFAEKRAPVWKGR